MSPWASYAIDVIQSLRILAIIVAVLSTCGCFFICSAIEDARFIEDDVRRFVLILFVTGVISTILSILLPSRDTMVQICS